MPCDLQRDNLVVVDGDGVAHISILCTVQRGVTGALLPPFVCAMCDYFDAIDRAAQPDPAGFRFPERTWTPDDEAPGVVSCIFCLGV